MQIASLPELRIERNSFLTLPSLLAERGFRRIGLVHGRTVYRNHGPEFEASLKEAGIEYLTREVVGEPSPGIVDSIAEEWRDASLELIVALGGGSVIDAGKAAAAMLGEPGEESVKEFLEGVGTRSPSGRTLPLYALPTTAGTGSEATKNAVISEIGGFKKSLRHDNFVPKLALLDARLALGVPDDVTRASGLDGITQLLEAYLSTKANPFTDALALSGLEAAGGAFPQLLKDPADIAARESMAYAAYLSGVCLANAGLGLVHGAASPLGAAREIPHGLVCGRLLPGVLRRIEERAVGDELIAGKLTAAAAALRCGGGSLALYLEELLRRTGLPGFRAYGFDEESLEGLAAECGRKNSPVDFTNAEIRTILKEAL